MSEGAPILLDGGTATELHRAGVSLREPWWTSRVLLTGEKRALLRDVHRSFIAAGAEVITANTFRCNLRTLRRAGLDAAGLGWMVHAAVGVALAARAESAAAPLVAGSVAPVEDCYRPDLAPPDDDMRDEHRWLTTELVRAGVDLVLIETMNTVREARIALEAAQEAGARAWVGFACRADGRLLSGEDLGAAARAVEDAGAEAVLVNCTAPAAMERCLAALSAACSGPIGASPNLEDRTGVPPRTPVDRPLPTALDAEGFAELADRWRTEHGLRIVGGCCGTTPAHLAALGDRFTSRSAALR
ncbi:homocysteine S-methyltransferase family protein [Saccharopolyspora sp. CA-218241]|uniref:homocysteine S-methyltransferase family protein n=1 Tax=Saccharopolyspora sp. CA-218241 TaxID=3240027 RepID=UPI003D986CF4